MSSASSHTRGHRSAPEYPLAVLCWLESHQRTVVNGSRALDLEISKLRQYQALRVAGVLVPTTQVARTSTELLHLASHQQEPFIIKPNRGGKGLGVQLVDSTTALRNLIKKDQLPHSLDGLYLVQQFIHNPLACITRCEFIGGKFIYAVEVNTNRGFELCPAESLTHLSATTEVAHYLASLTAAAL